MESCSGRRVSKVESGEWRVESAPSPLGREVNPTPDPSPVGRGIVSEVWSAFIASAQRSWRRETRSIFLRWLKTVFTIRRKSCSSQPREETLLRVMRMTADCTLGGGLKTDGSTVKRYSTSYHAWIRTERMP